MAETPYITADELKAVTEVQENVDRSLLTAGILKAQRLHIRPVLGFALSGLLDAYVRTLTPAIPPLIPPAPNPAMADLLDRVRPALCWWGFYHALPKLHLKVTNKGVVTKASEPGSSNTDLNGIAYLRSDVSEDAKSYTAELVAFLELNAADYPDYVKNSGAEKPASAPGAGIFFGDGDGEA